MSEALNAESVLASIVELRKSIAESNAELRESIAEQGKRMEKETAELRASIAESKQETAELRASIAEQGKRIDVVCERLDEQGKCMDKVLDELRVNNHRVGELTNKVGRIVEKVVVPNIVDKFNEKGFKFDAVSTNVEFLNEKKNGNLTEIDALLENGKFVIAVETKMDLSVSDVNAHIKRLQALRKVPRFKGKKIYGAVSTAIAREKPVNYALSKGFYVLRQPDVMAVKIMDFPKGRSAKAW